MKNIYKYLIPFKEFNFDRRIVFNFMVVLFNRVPRPKGLLFRCRKYHKFNE